MPLSGAPAVQQRAPAVPPVLLLFINERREGQFCASQAKGRGMIAHVEHECTDGCCDKEGIAPRHAGRLLPRVESSPHTTRTPRTTRNPHHPASKRRASKALLQKVRWNDSAIAARIATHRWIANRNAHRPCYVCGGGEATARSSSFLLPPPPIRPPQHSTTPS